MESANSLIFLILGIGLGLMANIGSLWVLNAFGRRLLVLLSLSITVVLCLAMGIAGCFEGVVTLWYTSVTMMIVTMVCGLGIWPASHVIAAETSSLQLRAKSQGIGWFVSGISQGVFSISLTYRYNLDAGNLKAKTGFVMAGLALIGIVATLIWVPEMKGRTSMEIHHMFALNLKTRAFKNWRSDVFIEKDLDPLGRPAEV
ncbi:uncharacterized protein N7477_006304 [Penicillium maclennaniae]|uniref:uncharacterized protein n=1 Tax=Penicillium maclennaniae TaxID=1343394 RepID=UPI0025418BED|nr:uncharacterized protein N7477_006304 [Penicillium maclennaniae]KAJ5667734.1 hypothetical protein N7477_006304 [Penicillium maclennaniae]